MIETTVRTRDNEHNMGHSFWRIALPWLTLATDQLKSTRMENKKTGYSQQAFKLPVKRYCQTLDLKDDPALIAEYIKRHSEIEAWPEIRQGIREVGILEMELYILGTRLFMIVETPVDFEWERAMTKLATLNRQAEWEEYMSIFQIAKPGATSAEKWQLMDRIFYLYK